MKLNSVRGFTLLEIIITLTTLAVLATMIYTYFGKAFLESVTPITRLRNTAALQRVMENITADYNIYPKWRSGTDYANASYVIPTSFNGHYYQCQTTTGKSGNIEPTWGLKSGGPTPDNTITWVEKGRLRNLVSLFSLQTKIGMPEGSEQTAKEYGKNTDGTYTKYTVVKNRFVQFTSNTEADDNSGANNILKVTLQNEQGESLTALFYSDETS
jgi:prepilin-type N-terminal cleavage/methylation domain-containing protein